MFIYKQGRILSQHTSVNKSNIVFLRYLNTPWLQKLLNSLRLMDKHFRCNISQGSAMDQFNRSAGKDNRQFEGSISLQ